MNEESRRIWNSPEGVSLLKAMLAGAPLDEKDRQALAELKQADPPKTRPEQSSPEVEP